MLKSAGTSNLECTQHAVPGRKSLLACALLAMLAGNQAMADSSTNGDIVTGAGVTELLIDDSVGGVGNENLIYIDAVTATISVEDGPSGKLTNIGAVQSTFTGDVTFNTSNVNLINGASLSVDGNTSVGTLGATDVTADSVTAAAVNGTTVNSTTIANSGSITSDTINATTITGGTITGSLNAAGTVVSNVGNGVADSDAVNVSQLNAMQGASGVALNNFANEVDSRFNAVDRRIDKVEERAYAGIASVAALAAIPSPANGKRFSVGAGLGNYSSESAIAVGFRAAITESTSVTAGVSRNTASKTAANLGVGYSW